MKSSNKNTSIKIDGIDCFLHFTDVNLKNKQRENILLAFKKEKATDILDLKNRQQAIVIDQELKIAFLAEIYTDNSLIGEINIDILTALNGSSPVTHFNKQVINL